MKIVYFVDFYEDDIGSVQGMIMDGKLIGTWMCNDANWREEYFSEFIQNLGFHIEYSIDENNHKLVRDYWTGCF